MVRGIMSAQTEHYKWIAFADLIAKGEVPISQATLERIARQKQFEGPDRLQLAAKTLRNTVRVLLEAVHGPSRRSVIEFLGLVYKHEKAESMRRVRRQRFEIGDRVTMSDKAIAAGFNGRFDRRDGIVARLPNDPQMLVVLRDGRKQPEYYHVSFWVNASRA